MRTSGRQMPSSGPEEISNCPDILSNRRIHVYTPQNRNLLQKNNNSNTNYVENQKVEIKLTEEVIHEPVTKKTDEVWHYDIDDDIRSLAGLGKSEKINRNDSNIEDDISEISRSIEILCEDSVRNNESKVLENQSDSKSTATELSNAPETTASIIKERAPGKFLCHFLFDL